MLAELHLPTYLSPKDLDNYLAKGWFRIDQTVFTTNFIAFHQKLYSVIWLRIDLNTFTQRKTHQKLIKLNAKFRTEIRPAGISEAQEALFAKYRQTLSFNHSSSLHNLLYNQHENNVFNTYEINIYDQDKLIASGYFDLGEKSAEGIAAFYDPEYKKYSLGKYLMFLKIDFCKQLGMDFFYPGYFVPRYPLFDYKLDLAPEHLFYFDVLSQDWMSFEQFSYEKTPLKNIEKAIESLQKAFEIYQIPHKLFYYEFFDACLIANFSDPNLLDFPIFLRCIDLHTPYNFPIVIYDPTDSQYHLLLCESIYDTTLKPTHDNHYTDTVLQIIKNPLSCDSADEMASALAIFIFQATQKNIIF